jgi:hypothetical protein
MFYFAFLVQVYRPPRLVIDSVKTQFRFGETLYQHPFVPGYVGINHAGEGWLTVASLYNGVHTNSS